MPFMGRAIVNTYTYIHTRLILLPDNPDIVNEQPTFLFNSTMILYPAFFFYLDAPCLYTLYVENHSQLMYIYTYRTPLILLPDNPDN